MRNRVAEGNALKFRAFIAVEAGELFRPENVMRELRGSGADLKCVDVQKFHATLKFLGDTDEELVPQISAAMDQSVKGQAPFEVKFSGIGAFPNEKYTRVIWAGMTGAEPLVLIAQKLEEKLQELGFKKEGPFIPHITLARVRSQIKKVQLQKVYDAHRETSFGKMTVSRIILKKSVLGPGGPEYSSVYEAPLRRN